MASLFLSRILGIVRDSIMAAKFGIDAHTDAYRLAFQVPDLIFFLVAGGALSSAFIPVFSEYLHTDREEEAWKIFGTVVTIMSLALFLFIGAAYVFAEPLSHLVAPGKSEELIPLIARMSRILLPAQFAFFIGGLMFGTLYSRHRFVAPGLAPNVYNLGIIVGALVISQFVSPGIVGMAWGALIGAVIGNLLIPAAVMANVGSRFRLSLDYKHPGVRKVFKLMLPVVLGLSLPGVYGLIMQGFGSFYPNGINTALDLANKLMQAPLGVFGQSLALAVFPALSQFFAQKTMDRYRSQLTRTLCTVVFLTLPVTMLMIVLAPDIANVAFHYGKGQEGGIGNVADALRMFAIGVSAWCLHPVLMRAYFAMQVTVKPIVLGTITTAIFLALAFTLRTTPLGYLALPLASSISAIVLAALLIYGLANSEGHVDVPKLLSVIGRCSTAALISGGFVWIAARWIPDGTGLGRNVSAAIRILGPGIIGAWAYYFIARALKISETEYLDRAFAKLKRKRTQTTLAEQLPEDTA